MDNWAELQRALSFLVRSDDDILIVWRVAKLTRSIIDFQKIQRVGPKFLSVVEWLHLCHKSQMVHIRLSQYCVEIKVVLNFSLVSSSARCITF